MLKQTLKNIPFTYKYSLILKQALWIRSANKAYNAYALCTTKHKLQFGAGTNYLNGWFNTDYFPRKNIYFLNSVKPLNFPNASFDFIFSEHHIEHIEYNEAKSMIAESYRILKKNGVLRICTPDLSAYLNAYTDNDESKNLFVNDIMNNWVRTGFHKAKNYLPENGDESRSFFINDVFMNYEHKFIYDFETLKYLLVQAGFKKVYSTPANTSRYSELNNIESHNQSFAIPFTLAIEAVK